MDINEPTAWDDINPPMASVPRPEPVLPSSAKTQPATREHFRNELVACLALVAPVGMTEEAKRDWLKVAWATLKHLPADILASGCRIAREKCDHPAKVVPAILEATAQAMRWRRDAVADHMALPAPSRKSVMDRRGETMSEADTKELNDILENLGATARYRPDGSRFTTET